MVAYSSAFAASRATAIRASLRQGVASFRRPVLEMQHVIQSAVAEVLVDEQPLPVLHTAANEFLHVGVPEPGDAMDGLQELSHRRSRCVAVELQH